jgi:hypothetical protein
MQKHDHRRSGGGEAGCILFIAAIRRQHFRRAPMQRMIVMVRKSPVERRDGDAVLWFVEGPGLLCAFSNPLRRQQSLSIRQ